MDDGVQDVDVGVAIKTGGAVTVMDSVCLEVDLCVAVEELV